MKTIRSLILCLVIGAFASPIYSAELAIEPDLDTFKVDAKTKKVDLSGISEKVKAEKSKLPVDQLSDDFNSLISENGEVDRDAIEFDDAEVNTASE